MTIVTSRLGPALCPVVQETNEPDQDARTKYSGDNPVFVLPHVDQDRLRQGPEEVTHESHYHRPDGRPDRITDKERIPLIPPKAIAKGVTVRRPYKKR